MEKLKILRITYKPVYELSSRAEYLKSKSYYEIVTSNSNNDRKIFTMNSVGTMVEGDYVKVCKKFMGYNEITGFKEYREYLELY